MPFVEAQGRRVLFVHIPKTGGTSIEEAMEAVGPLRLCARAIPKALKVPPEHLTYPDLESLLGDDYFDYAFTVVRDPYARLESEYRMRSILSSQGLWGAMPRFSIWLDNALETVRRDRSHLANHFRPQVDFLGKAVKAFRYEDSLEAAVSEVGRATGLSLRLPGVRRLDGASFAGVIRWQAHDVQRVNDFYRDDFETLGYPRRDPGLAANLSPAPRR